MYNRYKTKLLIMYTQYLQECTIGPTKYYKSLKYVDILYKLHLRFIKISNSPVKIK